MSLKSQFVTITLFSSLLAASQTSYAWSDLGHKLVGSIAESMMTQDAKDLVRGILGIEPMYAAAIWPDLVRDDNRFTDDYDFSPYHYCEIPVGSTYDSSKVAKDCHSAIKFAQDMIKNPKNPRETKIISLRYLIHVVGDIHQPLHVGNGFDRGANACSINWVLNFKDGTSRSKKMNFHSFWDDTMVDEMRYALSSFAPHNQVPVYVKDVFLALKAARPEMFTAEAKAKYAVGTLPDWLNESASIRETIYPDKPEDMKDVPKGEEYKNRPYCKYYVDQINDKAAAPNSKIKKESIPDLSSDYFNKNLTLLEDQLLKGGLRLAAILDQMAQDLKDQEALRLNDEAEKAILKQIIDTWTNFSPSQKPSPLL